MVGFAAVALISVSDVSLRLGPRTLFSGLDLGVEPKDRLGVVGPNGAGKSTLLRILAGKLTPDGGSVRLRKGIRVGYLAQEHGTAEDESLVEHLLGGAPGRDELEAEIESLEAAIASTTDEAEQTDLAGQLSELHEALVDLDRRFGRHEAERILSGLGFSNAELERPVESFSGGWRMRAALGRILFERNDVLLLDEPTNHLDVPSIEWLSNFLSDRRQALVLTSHDRTFLNRHIDRVASLEVEGVRTFRGDYDAYLEQRAQELEFLEAAWAKSEKRQKELEAFVTRFKAKATKARQAQSKQKLIEKMKAETADIPKPRQTLTIRFPPVTRTGDQVIRVRDLTFGYGEKPVLRDVNLTVTRGERVALVGVNGSGKSTLLKLLGGELEAGKGTITLGKGVERRYFAQHHAETLADGDTILNSVWAAHDQLSQTAVRSLCGAFLFGGDEVEKPVGVLSGGERSRVALARILARPGNVLLLDEPTNHLDTDAADALTESLADFDGTVVFVSHSFRFIDRLATELWEVRNGSVVPFMGTFAEYLTSLHAAQSDLYARNGSGSASSGQSKAERMAEREAKKERARMLRRLERDVEAAEMQVTKAEAEVQRLEAELSRPEVHTDPSRSAELGAAFERAQAKAEAALERWTGLQTELESIPEP